MSAPPSEIKYKEEFAVTLCQNYCQDTQSLWLQSWYKLNFSVI